MTLSIVVATKGRTTLTDTLQSVCPQLQPGDEVLVVRSDYPWGHRARNEAMSRCRGTHLAWIDDDDVYVEDALALIRKSVAKDPTRVHLFRMLFSNGTPVIPRWPIQLGFIGTPMFVVPRKRGKLGRWSNRYEGDFDFIRHTMKIRGDEPMIHKHAVAVIAPR